MNKFAEIFQLVFKLAPYVLAGVESIHAGESTETKTQLAQQTLGIAAQAAVQNLPANDANLAAQAAAIANAGIAFAQSMNSTPAPVAQANDKQVVAQSAATGKVVPVGNV